MDIVNQVDRHPHPGETIHGRQTLYSPGGKGANQAVAASRAGAEVIMIGAVGEDPFQTTLFEALHTAGISTGSVLTKSGSSGLAFITVSMDGENSIILSEGANGKLTSHDVDQQLLAHPDTQAILFQNEIPWETTIHAILETKRMGCTIYLNPAPARVFPDEILACVDVLILNEFEAELMSGVHVSNANSAIEAANRLLKRGSSEIIITMGAEGSIYKNQEGLILPSPAFLVQAVDTTAAGDTFIGTYAASRGSGLTVEDSLRRASAAAALTVTRAGAQGSIPTKAEVNQFLSQQ